MGFSAIVETPKGSAEKYEPDMDGRLVNVGRYSLPFPAHYGSILDTIAGDGDLVDVIIASCSAYAVGDIVEVRPVGVLHMLDRGEHDEKIVAVDSKDPTLARALTVNDIDGITEQYIEDFIARIKAAAGDRVIYEGWGDADAAEALINTAKKRYVEHV